MDTNALMGMLFASQQTDKEAAEERARELVEENASLRAECDRYKAILDGPEWSTFEETMADRGPFEALQEARKIMIQSHDRRLEAERLQDTADAKLVAAREKEAKADKMRQDAARRQAQADAEFERYQMATAILDHHLGQAGSTADQLGGSLGHLRASLLLILLSAVVFVGLLAADLIDRYGWDWGWFGL